MALFKSNITGIYLFKFFASFHLFSAILVPFFTDWGGISFTQVMLLQSWFMVWIFLLEVPTGAIADYFGRKHSLVLACMVNIAGTVVAAIAPDFGIFLLAELLWAASVALLTGADSAFVYDALKESGETETSKKVFTRIESIGKIALMVAPPIGSLIAVHYGLRATLLSTSIPFFIAFLIGLSLREPRVVEKIKSTKPKYLDTLKTGVKYFYKNKILKILAFDMISIDTVAYLVIWLYQPMLMQAGVSLAFFGFVHAGFILNQILVMNSYSKLERILHSKKRLLFYSAIVLGVMLVVGGLTKYIPFVVAVIIIGAGFGLSRKPLFMSYMNKYIESSERATILSTVSMIRRFGLAIIIPIVGISVDWSLSYTLIILGVITIIFALLSKIKEEHLVE